MREWLGYVAAIIASLFAGITMAIVLQALGIGPVVAFVPVFVTIVGAKWYLERRLTGGGIDG